MIGMTKYYCNACDWTGEESALKVVPLCPVCRCGHRIRLMPKGNNVYECPNCSMIYQEGEWIPDPECPVCANQYLKVVEG